LGQVGPVGQNWPQSGQQAKYLMSDEKKNYFIYDLTSSNFGPTNFYPNFSSMQYRILQLLAPHGPTFFPTGVEISGAVWGQEL